MHFTGGSARKITIIQDNQTLKVIVILSSDGIVFPTSLIISGKNYWDISFQEVKT